MNNNNLFKEALADAQKLREVAIKDAENTVLEALAPRIKQFVEEHLLETSIEGPPRIMGNDTDAVQPIDNVTTNADIETPLNIVAEPCDTCCDSATNPDTESVVAFEFGPFSELQQNVNTYDDYQLESLLKKIGNLLEKRYTKNVALSETKSFGNKIVKIISEIENMYGYVQEVVSDPARKEKLNEQFEIHYRDLKQLEEAMKTRKIKLTEADELDLDVDSAEGASKSTEAGEGTKKVSLNINVPETIADQLVDSLSDIEISLPEDGEEEIEISDELGGEESSGEEDLDIDLDAGTESGDGEKEGEEEELQLSSKQMTDDTVVEIDENMLRSELNRMRAIKESGVPTPSADGSGVDDAALAAFGGGADGGDPFVDVDVETAETQVAEAIKREKRIQKVAQYRGKQLQAEGRKALATKNIARYKAAKTQYLAEAKKYTDSVKRVQQLTESPSRSSNSSSSATVGGQLAESNLNNAKLLYAKKVLQTSISNKNKLKIVEQLETVKTPQEAKTIFESAIKLIGEEAERITETKSGSSSRAVRSGGPSATLNEGFELGRWSRLAGLEK